MSTATIQTGKWTEVARGVLPDDGDGDGDGEIARTWYSRRDVAEREARLYAADAAEDCAVPYIETGRLRRSAAIDLGCGEVLINEPTAIEDPGLERIPGRLVREEVEALQLLREAETDIGVWMWVRDALIARAVERDEQSAISTADVLQTIDGVLERAGWMPEQRETELIGIELRPRRDDEG